MSIFKATKKQRLSHKQELFRFISHTKLVGLKGQDAQQTPQSRPAWKVLRVLGNLLNLQDFDEESSEAVRDTVLAAGAGSRLSNTFTADLGRSLVSKTDALERVADLPIYRSDALVRRSAPLQQMRASKLSTARLHPDTLQAHGVSDGDEVRLRTSYGEMTIPVQADSTVPAGAVRLSAGFPETAQLGSIHGQLQMERV